MTGKFDRYVDIPSEWKGFKRGLLGSPRCKGCERNCIILYDSHHEQFFSASCGCVIMEMDRFLVSY